VRTREPITITITIIIIIIIIIIHQPLTNIEAFFISNTFLGNNYLVTAYRMLFTGRRRRILEYSVQFN
jgi:hypothetical protein